MTSTSKRFLFATTGLALCRTDRPEDYPRDWHLDETCYRKVDPPYFAWLRHRMLQARRRFEAGRLPATRWHALRGRFNHLQAWALDYYGKDALMDAVRELNPAAYVPPRNRMLPPFRYPETCDLPFSQRVAWTAVRKVDAIRGVALARGWPEARLYQNHGRFGFPLGGDYGLVCFLGPEDAIGEISETYIEIIHGAAHGQHTLRFYHPNAIAKRKIPEDARS